MKNWMILLLFFTGSTLSLVPQVSAEYNFGDFRSETLSRKAWEALEKNDLDAVLAYTNKNIELYGDQAKKMQASLTDYPTGISQEIFKYWALNDIATSLFIQGEAYRKSGLEKQAKEAYKTLIEEFSYGQCWDPKGWFWKPAETAQEKLAMIESGSQLDFGDYTSETLTKRAWEALASKDIKSVEAYVNKCLELFEDKAREMQGSLTEYPWESKDRIFSYWALNDVGTCLFIQGEAYRNAGETGKAKKTFKKLVDEFSYAQCWDPQGWFWKPADAAQQKLQELGAS